eukprot:TRINITY_DN10484_c0_g1_i3.p2 TRINITY_DN10484_c0_g1~~TRINITY_DN10484_c0_g1_i3.p2  ORF type:complete len:153 (+),score=56.42 TRINITY_DN10484_c0_g1_i3:1093-1551(+)
MDTQPIRALDLRVFAVVLPAHSQMSWVFLFRLILEAEAEAEAIRARGEAEAFAINAKAQADAEAMQKKASAWEQYQGAAVVDMVLQTLPKVAAEVAAPLATVDKVTMVAGPNGEVGAAKITQEVLSIMNALPEMVNQMTGIDLNKVVKATRV